MKKCAYCGREYPDETTECVIDHQPLASSPPEPEPATAVPEPEQKSVTVDIFTARDTAELAVAKLEAYGVRCWLKSDDAGGMYPNLALAGGIRLQVSAKDAETAFDLLNAKVSPAEISELESTAVARPPEGEQIPKGKFAPIPMLAGVGMGIVLCLLFQWSEKLGTKTFYYYGRNGKPYEAWVYRNGHEVEFLQDRNRDGKWDHWTHYEHGRAVRSEYDNNFDGKPDEWWSFSDDGRDTLKKDSDFNGIPDEFCTYKDQIIQRMDMKPNDAKFTTVREFFQNGVLTEIDRGGESNGTFKQIIRYDPFFNPIGVKPINSSAIKGSNLLLPVSGAVSKKL